MSDAGRALWDAVDSITKPTHRRVDRDSEAEVDVAGELLRDLADNPRRLVCSILEKRRADTLAKEMTAAYGQIPALWDQAEWSLTPAMETRYDEEGSGCQRERSPADLDLMETMLTIRETIATQLEGRGIRPRKGPKERMRQLAAWLVTNAPPEHVEWWTFRFQQWARLLNTHLNAAEHVAKPVHLRNTACPECSARQVTLADNTTGERKVWPAIVIDFENCLIRAAWCQACGHAWFRGNDLGRLAELTDTHTSDLAS